MFQLSSQSKFGRTHKNDAKNSIDILIDIRKSARIKQNNKRKKNQKPETKQKNYSLHFEHHSVHRILSKSDTAQRRVQYRRTLMRLLDNLTSVA